MFTIPRILFLFSSSQALGIWAESLEVVVGEQMEMGGRMKLGGEEGVWTLGDVSLL